MSQNVLGRNGVAMYRTPHERSEKSLASARPAAFWYMVGQVGFEPTANCLRGNCSTGLSY